MLKAALNALTALQSRPAMLKRLGDTDMYSPIRITPSNYFRFLRGPEYTTIKGVEYIIPVDSMTGQFAQLLSFDVIPDSGDFKIQFGSNITTALPFNTTAADIQTALRIFMPLAKVLVTGSFMTGFTIIFAGFDTPTGLGQTVDNTLQESGDDVITTWADSPQPWSDPIKKGDRIIDGNKQWAIGDIMEMQDVGAQTMAFRIHAD